MCDKLTHNHELETFDIEIYDPTTKSSQMNEKQNRK